MRPRLRIESVYVLSVLHVQGGKNVKPSPKQSEKHLKAVRVNDEKLNALLDKMESSTHSPGSERRTNERYDYRTQTIVHIQQPGDSHFAPYMVPTRNLSEGGTSFLYGGFIHSGTCVIVQLATPDGTLYEIRGKVVGCRYVEGSIHEVMVCFDKPIDPSIYCMNAPCGCVLLAEDDPAAVRLAIFHLKELNVRIEVAANGREILDKVQDHAYDIILMDMELPEIDGFEVVETLRQNGYMGKIVAVTGLTQPKDRRRCMEVGCDYYLAKPYLGEELAELLTLMRDKPIYSAYFDNASMSDIINEFVAELPSKIRSVQESLFNENTDMLLTQVRDLKGVGTGYGFAGISALANEVESRLLAKDAMDAVREEVDRLVKLCMQVRPNPQAGGIRPMSQSSSST